MKKYLFALLLFAFGQVQAQRDTLPKFATYWYSAAQATEIAKATNIVSTAPNKKLYTAVCEGFRPCNSYEDIVPVCQIAITDTIRIIDNKEWRIEDWNYKPEIQLTIAGLAFKVKYYKSGWFELIPLNDVTMARTTAISYFTLKGFKKNGVLLHKMKRGKVLIKPYVTWETLSELIK